MVLGVAKRPSWRKVWAYLFLVLLGLALAWSFKKDFAAKQYQGLLQSLKGPNISYILNLNSFDTDTQEVKGVLSFEEGLSMKTNIQMQQTTLFYTPLSYSDLTYRYALFRDFDQVKFSIGLLRGELLPVKKSFTKSPPSPINVSIKALGNTNIYPFDKHFIMGAVNCQAYIKKGKQEEYIHTKEDGESLNINSNVNGFFIRHPTNVELDEIKRVFIDRKEPRTVNAELREMNNLKNRFALVLERPYYLKMMTVILGTIALLSALYIGFKTPFKDFPIQVIGYVIGVWGIRNILIGDLKIFPSYFDYALLGMYVLLFGGIIFRRIRGGTNEKEAVSRTP